MRSNLHRFSENEDFLKSLTVLTKKAKCKLTVCPEEENLEDQWMQVHGPVHLSLKDKTEALSSWGTPPSWDGVGK